MPERVLNLLLAARNPSEHLCGCELCEATRRINHLSSTRWVRRKTLQRELSALYDAYFEVSAELELLEAHVKESASGS